MLVKQKLNNYKNGVSITFTNKYIMKVRIILPLNGL